MTMLDASADAEHLDKIINTMPKIINERAREEFSRGAIKEGEPFEMTEVDGRWKAGIFVSGKLIVVSYLLHPEYRLTRLDVQKRKGIARLLYIAQTKWVPTSPVPWLPQRYQHLDSGKVVYSPHSQEREQEDARSDTPVIDPEFHAEIPVKTQQEVEQEQADGLHVDLDAPDPILPEAVNTNLE